jgi:F420H(2)-dependent quinone reductase
LKYQKGENVKVIDSHRIEMNRRVIEEFRANSGKVQGWGPLILLTTKGVKTGQTRIYPLMSVPYGENYIAVASKGGAPKNPLWYNNVLAHPIVTVENGNETFAAQARLLSGAEREQAFERAVSVYPPYADYQKKTEREIPVFLLERNTNST